MTSAALSPLLPPRVQQLRDALLATIDSLKRRQASEIDSGFIDDYVALNWLEWHGGTLRLTTTGQNIRQQLLAHINRSGADSTR